MDKVLVVDQVPEVVRLIANVLRTSGYEVLEAASGSAALDILQSHTIHVLVTGAKAADLTGAELVCRAWDSAPELPVVFIAAYAEADEIPCDMLCRVLIVTKPSVKALRKAVAQALDRLHPYGDDFMPFSVNAGRGGMKLGLSTGMSCLLGL